MTTAIRRMTREQYLALPEEKPYLEFVDGEVLSKPMPTGWHAMIQSLLAILFGEYRNANPGGLFGSEWRCTVGPAGAMRDYVPDFIYLLPEQVPSKRAALAGAFHGAPALVVEMLSPDDKIGRTVGKLLWFLAHGSRAAWLIDPKHREILMITHDSEAQVYGEQDALTGGTAAPGLAVTVADLLPPVR